MEEIFLAQAEGDRILIKMLRSRLDAAGVSTFKDRIEAVWKDGLTSADIDMSSIEFIDSSGIGALLSVYRRLPEGTASVTLSGLRPQVQAVIELLRLHKIFAIQA